MYVVLTEKRAGVIIGIGEPPLTEVDGGMLLEDTIYPSALRLVVNEVDTVPAEVIAIKYCYSPENGFYPNPHYVPHGNEMQEHLSRLQDESLMALEGIATLYEMMLGGVPQ